VGTAVRLFFPSGVFFVDDPDHAPVFLAKRTACVLELLPSFHMRDWGSVLASVMRRCRTVAFGLLV